MSLYPTTRKFAGIAAAGFIVLIGALVVIRSQRGDDAGIGAPFEREEADALVSELARCRTITPEQTASLENCRRVWAENRRQFFKPTKAPPAAAEPIPTAASGSGRREDRVSPLEAEHQQREVR